MEFNFALIFVAALAGLVAKRFIGWDPQRLWAGLILLIPFVFPALGLALETDSAAVQEKADSMIERVIASMPSVAIGDAAGLLAGIVMDAVEGALKRR